jgi:DedD protein
LVALVLILPMVLDEEPKRATNDIVVHIPTKENVPFNPDLAPAEEEVKPEPVTPPAPVENTPIPAAPPEPVVNTPTPAEPEDLEAPPPAVNKPVKPATAGGFFVQVGVFSKAENAKSVQAKLAKNKLTTVVERIKTSAGERTRVRVGPFATRGDADKALSTVKRAGEKNAVIVSVEARR